MGRVGQGSRDEHAKMSGVYIVGARQFTSTIISNDLHDAVVGTTGIECLHFSMQFVSLV